MTMLEFQGTCIYSIPDEGGAFCNVNSNYPIECAYTDRWNECKIYKPVRQAMRDINYRVHLPTQPCNTTLEDLEKTNNELLKLYPTDFALLHNLTQIQQLKIERDAK
jgi:hypothetical protein